jgi:hypothetical protein
VSYTYRTVLINITFFNDAAPCPFEPDNDHSSIFLKFLEGRVSLETSRCYKTFSRTDILRTNDQPYNDILPSSAFTLSPSSRIWIFDMSQQIPQQSARVRVLLREYLSFLLRINTEGHFGCENLDIVWPIDKVDEVDMCFFHCLVS